MKRVLGRFAAVVMWSCVLVCTAASSDAAAPKARGVTDASASDKAEAAVATLADLGAGWTQYQNAGGTQKIDKQDCTIKAGSGFKASDTGYAGAAYRDATETMF